MFRRAFTSRLLRPVILKLPYTLSGLTGESFIGLQFQLSALSGSIVTVLNLRLESAAAIPEPSSLSLFAVGMIGIAIRGLRSRRATSYRQRS